MATDLKPQILDFLKQNPKSDLAIMAQHFGVSTNRLYTIIEKMVADPETGIFSEFGLSAKRTKCRVYSLKGFEAPEGYVPPYVGTQVKAARANKANLKPKEKIKKTKEAIASSPQSLAPVTIRPALAMDPLEGVHVAIEQFAMNVGTMIGEQVAKKVSEVVMERFAENLSSISEEMASKLTKSITSSVTPGRSAEPGAAYDFKKPVVLIHGLPQSQQKIISEQFRDHLEIHYPGHVNLAEQIVNHRPKEAIVMVDMIGADVVKGLKMTGVIYNGLKGSMTNLQKHLQESLVTRN